MYEVRWHRAEQLGLCHWRQQTRRCAPPPASTVANLIIYELMTDDFTKGYRGGRAPIDAVLDKLDYIAGLGFNAIEFMPWIAWPDENPYSWGYDPAYYFSAESLYVGVAGDETDRLVRINRLVNECHKRGLHVILDVVLQHAQQGPTDGGFPYYWLWQQPEESPFYGKYTDADTFGSIPLNYFNKCTEEFAIDVCFYWANKLALTDSGSTKPRDFDATTIPQVASPGSSKAYETASALRARTSHTSLRTDGTTRLSMRPTS